MKIEIQALQERVAELKGEKEAHGAEHSELMGSWKLVSAVENGKAQSRLLLARYDDEYLLVDGEWKHKSVRIHTNFFEDIADGVFSAGSDASRKEAAFALDYTAKETDIIPDFVPDIGYADDSIIVRTVLSRHEEIFRDYCGFRKIRWSNMYFAP